MTSRTVPVYQKTEAISDKGMVAAMHPFAAEAGAEILAMGGNAVDAAVAIGFGAGVVEPYNSGLGGIAVFVHYDARTGKSTVIDGTAPLPRSITPDAFTLADSKERAGLYQWRAVKDDANNTGHLSVAVPGMPACMCEAHARLGSLSLQEVTEPAIRLAEQGHPVIWPVAFTISNYSARLKQFPGSRQTFFHPDGSPLQPESMNDRADLLVQPWLAATLRRIAEQGAAGFYEGETAHLIAEDMRANGGLLDEEDLASYRARVFESGLISTYHDFSLIISPVTNGSPSVVEMLNIVENDYLADFGQNSAAAMHLLIEAQRRGFVDRFQHLGDPDFAPVPTEGIVSKEFAAQRRATIDLNQATPLEGAGDPWPFERERKEAVMAGSGVPGGEGNTTHFTVIDGDRNMVSCVSTLGGHFGSAVINPGAGVVLNNGVMWFDPEPGSLVTVGPGKRIMTAGSPVLVLDKDGQPFLTIGAPGGRRVISAIFQSLVNVLDYGMGPAEAIGSPRSHCEGSGVEIDNRVPERTLEGLRRRGHDLDVREESLVFSNFARPNGIMVDPVTGALRGGVTPFGPATAVGL